MANLATINNNILADSGIDPLSLIVGTGTVNYVPKFTAEDTVANSQIFDNGTNVGIGTTSPVTKLDVNGAGVIRGFLTTTDAIKLGGNTSAPTSTDAFIYRPADNTLAFGTASAERMRLDVSGNLLVGLSSALANGKLQVAGSIGLSGNTQIRQATNSDGNTLQVFATQVIAGNLNSYSYGYSGGGLLASVSAGDSILLFDAGRTTSTEGRVKIANTTLGNVSFSVEKNGVTTLFASTLGNVGIGTNSPTQKLDVSGYIRATSGFVGNSGLSLWGDNSSSAAGLFVATGGNVGIGTTSPTSKLELYNSSGDTRMTVTSTGGTGASDLLLKNASGTVAYEWYVQALGADGRFRIFDNTGGSTGERLTIDQSGNVGIGTSSPSYPLTVGVGGSATGVLRAGTSFVSIDAGYQSAGVYGTAIAPSLIFGGDDNTGIWHPASDVLAVSTGGSERMRITSSGVVGIGTSSPVGLFEVKGDGVSYFTRGTKSILLNPNVVGGDVNALIETSTGMALAFGTNGSERMRIATTGAVRFNAYGSGSFTGTRAYDLSVDASGNIIEVPVGAGTITGSGTTNYIPKFTSSSAIGNSIVQDDGTNVGVGGSPSSQKLRIYGGTIISNNNFYYGFTSLGAQASITGITSGDNITLGQNNVNHSNTIIYGGTGTIQFSTGGSERMRLDASGNLGLGTSSPSYKFQAYSSGDVVIAATDASNAGVSALNLGNTTNLADGGIRYDNSTDALIFRANNSERMRLDASGNLGLGVTPSAFSSSYKAIQFGTTGSIFGESGDAANYYTTNTFIDAGGFKYITTDFALGYFQENGVHSWRTAASGSAGASISFTQAMTLDASGNLLVGATSTSQARGGASTRQLVKLGSGQSFLEIQAFNTSSDAGLLFANSNSSNYGLISYTPTDAMQFYANSAERMRLNTIGLGIGTSNPTSLLYLKGYVPTITFEGSGYVGDTWQIRTAASGSNSTFNFYNVTQGTYPLNIDGAGRVGIGTTTPAYKLDVINAGNTVARFLNSQTGANADLVIGNGNNSWTQRITGDGTYDYTLINNGTGARVLTALANGNVGIGTTSPGYKTEIRTDNQNATQTLLALTNSYGGATDGARLLFQVANTSGNGAAITGKRDGGTFGIDLLFETSSGVGSAATEKMRITSTGNVGIGTSSPSLISGYTGLNVLNSGYTQIKVQSTLTSAGIEFSPSSGFNYEIQASNSNQWFVYDRTSNAYRLVIHGTGNVSIGSNSDAGYKLDVNGIVRATGETILSGGTLYLNNTDNSQAAYLVSTGTGGSAPLIFATNSSERMRINPSGELLINTTTDYGDYKLQVNGNSYLGGNVQIGTSLNLGQSIIYTSTAFNYITGGSANWIKIGTLNMPQGGHNAYIRFYSGQGYNANNSQNGYVELFIRTSNGNSNDGGYYLSAFVQRFGYASFMTNFRLTANHPTSDNIDVYAYVQPYSGVGFYTVETSPSTSWTNSMTIVSEPTSYYTVTDNFKVLSYSTFENGIYTTSITFPGGGGSYNYITNSGLNLIINADDDIIFRNDNNIEKMRLTYYGYLGIGTSAPSNKLTVGGTNGLQLKLETSSGPNDYYAVLSANYNYAQSFFLRVKGGGNEQDIMQWGDGAGLYLNSRNSNPLVLQNAGGNVLINTTTDVGYKLNVVGNIASNAGTNEAQVFVTNSTSQIYLFNSYAGNTFGIYDGTAGQHRLLYDRASSFWAFYTGASERMRITSGGDVGIGTSSPTSQANYRFLQVNGTNSAIIETMVGGTRIGGFDSDASNLYVGSIGSYPIVFRTAVTERMRLTSGGYLGIGTTAPTRTLDVRSDVGVLIKGASSSTDATLSLVPASGGRQYDFRNYGSSFGIKDASADVIRMYFHYNGNTGIGTSNPINTGTTIETTGAVFSTTATKNSNMYGLTLVSTTNENTMSGVWFGSGGGSHWSGIAGSRSNYTADWSTHLSFYTHVSSYTNINDATEKMRITGDGNVWIGNDSNPMLEIANGGSTDALSGIRWVIGGARDNYGGIYTATSSAYNNYISFYTRSSISTVAERMRITSGGNVLVGTTTDAGYKLDVTGTLRVNGNNNTAVALTVNGSDASEGLVAKFARGASEKNFYISSTNNQYVNLATEGNFRFKTGISVNQPYTSGNDPMVLTSTGNVGIGTSSPTVKLQVSGTTLFEGGYANFLASGTIALRIGADGSNDIFMPSGRNLSISAEDNILFRTSGALTERFRITSGGNVGIGISAPTAILHTAGNTKLGGGTFQVSTDQTFISSYSYTFRDAVGINNPNSLSAASATTVMSIGSMTNGVSLITTGSVGIGTTSPTQLLTLEGADGYLFTVQENGANKSRFQIYQDDSGSSLVAGYNSTATNMYFYTGSSERMRITSGGRVGIGTSSPSYKLQVAGGDIAIDYNRYLRGGNGGDWNLINLYNGGTGDMEITMLNTNWYLRHNANATFAGRVGIGTTSPDASTMLQVQTSNSCSVRIVSSALSGGDLYLTSVNSGSESRIDKQGTAGPLTFYNNGSERMRLTSDGELLIGTTSDSGDFKLQVNGNGRFVGDIRATVDLYLSRTGTSPAIVLEQQRVRLVDQSTGYASAIDVYNDGLLFTGSIKTAAPSGGTAATWKLGSRISNTCGLPLAYSDFVSQFMNTNKVIEVEIGGVTVYIPTVTPGWC